MLASTHGVAYARAGLLGNPSDAYEGKAIAFSMLDFSARVHIEPAERFLIVPGQSDGLEFESLRDAQRSFASTGCEDGLRLLRAATLRFLEHTRLTETLGDDDPRLRFELGYVSDIPRQVGLSGSSAIVTAALRALMGWFDVEIEPAVLAELALSAELEDLRIAAGPMDRVIQSYEGVMLMDLAPPRRAASYTRLDPSSLPCVYVAYDPLGGENSGRPHGDLRARWEAGDPQLRRTMAIFPALVEAGVDCLERGDTDRFRQLVDRNFDTRCSIFFVGERDRAMVAIGRERGAACKLCGSGGAIVGVPRDAGDLDALEQAYRAAGFSMLRPTIGRGSDCP